MVHITLLNTKYHIQKAKKPIKTISPEEKSSHEDRRNHGEKYAVAQMISLGPDVVAYSSPAKRKSCRGPSGAEKETDPPIAQNSAPKLRPED